MPWPAVPIFSIKKNPLEFYYLFSIQQIINIKTKQNKKVVVLDTFQSFSTGNFSFR